MLTKEQEQDEAQRAARLAHLEAWRPAAERSTWVGPTKVVAALGEHKACGLDEEDRLRHAQRFAGSPAERAAREAETEHQLVAEKRARGAAERKA